VSRTSKDSRDIAELARNPGAFCFVIPAKAGIQGNPGAFGFLSQPELVMTGSASARSLAAPGDFPQAVGNIVKLAQIAPAVPHAPPYRTGPGPLASFS